MSTVVTLQDALAQSQTGFNAAITGLDAAVLEEEPAVGVWPVRDVVAHLIDWGNELLRAAEHGLGGPHPPGQPITDDDYNDKSVAHHAAEPWDSLKAQWDGMYDRALALAARLSPEELARPAEYAWGGTATVGEVLRAIVEHQEEHNTQIETWRAAGTPA